ncbi:MAG: IPT/TIG domain-containing protein [Nitrospiria bacterium]
MPDGRILILGGRDFTGALDSAEIFDLVSGAFSAANPMLSQPRADHSATLLPFGEILIAGGSSVPFNFQIIASGPTISSFTPTSGKAGTPVTIRGLNFDPVSSNNRVTFINLAIK